MNPYLAFEPDYKSDRISDGDYSRYIPVLKFGTSHLPFNPEGYDAPCFVGGTATIIVAQADSIPVQELRMGIHANTKIEDYNFPPFVLPEYRAY